MRWRSAAGAVLQRTRHHGHDATCAPPEEGDGGHDSMSEADPIEVTEANAGDALAGLPFIVRKALGYALKIKRGVLTVVLPGGKRFCFRGQQPGPEGALEVKTLGFARRLISGGDIGFAEAYIRGEWD